MIIVLIVIILVAYIMISRKEARKEDDENILAFYHECNKKGVYKLKGETFDEAITLIGAKYDITKYNVHEKYALGKRLDEQEKMKIIQERELKKQKEIEKEIEAQREKEIKEYYCEREISNYVGKEKYQYDLINTLATKKGLLESAEKLSSAVVRCACNIESAYKESQYYKQESDALRPEVKKIEKKIAFYDEILYDTSDKNKKFGWLEFSNWSYEKLITGNLKVKCTIEVNENPKIINKPASFDGSLKIDVLNDENEILGTGFFNGPVSGTCDTSEIGFKKTQDVSILCRMNELNKLIKQSDTDEYHFNVSPVNLWTLERKSLY